MQREKRDKFAGKRNEKGLIEGQNLEKKIGDELVTLPYFLNISIIFRIISKEKGHGSSCGFLHHVQPLVCANLNLRHALCEMGCLHTNLLH